MNTPSNHISRRAFLRRTAVSAATGVMAPLILPTRLFGATAPSNQLAVACIGVGNRGKDLLNGAVEYPNAKIVAVCDVMQERRDRYTAILNKRYAANICTAHRDLREMLARDDIDAVTIGTPDHWHVPAALIALRSGKDVYVEKPLSLSVAENVAIRRAVQVYGRVFQYGTQQRSLAHVRLGAELVRNGRLGKLQSVAVTAPSYGYQGGSLEPIPVPAGLDYDLWLGPAPWRPYTRDRCTEWGSYWCSDNSHGFIGGWGAHPLTDMLWALGDNTDAVPVEYVGTGKFGTGLFDAPYDWDIRGRFVNGADFHFTPGNDGVTITGTNGTVSISRAQLKVEPYSLRQEQLGGDDIRLYDSRNHMDNFLDSVRTRRPTVAPVEVAVLSDNITQLSLMAILTGRKIRWDPVREVIDNDPAAVQWLTRALREPWTL